MQDQRGSFTKMTDSTEEDWRLIAKLSINEFAHLPEKVLEHLAGIQRNYRGYAVDRIEHMLQSATLAHQAGRDEEYVVCALLHDIGEVLAPMNHAAYAAAILKPYISEKNYWMVEHHDIFQGYYFFHYLGADRDLREQYRGHPYFEYTAEFCEKFDQNAFDPNFRSMTLEDFAPMVKRVLTVPKHSPFSQSEVIESMIA